MWVFCGGMFRSASTLQFQITAQLIEDAQAGQRIGWIDAYRFDEVRALYSHESQYKVVKVHVCTASIQSEFRQHNALGLYIFRDIRDVFSSYLKQRQKPFHFLWNEGFLETCLDNYKAWTTLPNVLISNYHDVITNLPEEVHRIAQHLHLNVSPLKCHQIADNYSLDSQKQRTQRFREQLLQRTLNPNDHREIVDYHDEETLLHMNHIDSAQCGRWQTDLSPDESALIERSVIEWCKHNGYHPTLFLQTTGSSNGSAKSPPTHQLTHQT